MNTHTLQQIINFINLEKINLDDSTKYNITNKNLNKFIVANDLDIITYNFLHNNMINSDKNCNLNLRLIDKGNIYPTGITVNYLILLFCLWDDSQYLDIIKLSYSDKQARDHFKKHVMSLLFLKIENKKWTSFKNYILLFSKKKLSVDEYNIFYNTMLEASTISTFPEKYDLMQKNNFEEHETETRLNKLDNIFSNAEKTILK